MQKPLVSIITITFNLVKNNRAETFKQCLRSVHDQTYKNIEHLVIDGNSQDGTREILETYEKKGWIKFISEPDTGVYDAMNKGISLSKGKYLAFLNSDDFYHDKDGINESVKFIELNQSSLIFSNVNAINVENDELIGVWKGNIDRLLFGTHFCHQGTLIRKSILKKYKNFDINFKISADSDLIIKMVSKKEKIDYFNLNFASYRSGGLSGTYRSINRKEHASSFYKYIGKKEKLTEKDTFLLWNFSLFNELPTEEIIGFYKKIKNEKWKREFSLQLVNFLSINPSIILLDNRLNKNLLLTDKEKHLITKLRMIKHFFIPENSFSFKIFKKLKNLIKK